MSSQPRPAMAHHVRIGTRGSPLAMAQAEAVRAALLVAHDHLAPDSIEIVVFTTQGDRILDRALGDVGGKGLFTQEIEDALLAGQIDVAVHSMKDMPTLLPAGLMIGAVLAREAPDDVLLSRHAHGLAGLPQGATVGTASLRRQAQIRAARPDLNVVTFRGNVNTRLKKLSEGHVDATLLAQAGLNRLGFVASDLAPSVERLSHDVCLPATAQGIVGVECRVHDHPVLQALAPIHHDLSATVLRAERAVLAQLDGSCRTPIGAHATVSGDQMTLVAEVLMADGSDRMRRMAVGSSEAPEALGDALGRDIRQAGAHILATFS